MSSLYQIKSDILSIFNQIEESEGEITEDQDNYLTIKQEELVSKLDNYYKAILSWKADVDNCKQEEKRIASVRKKYDNRIDRLKSAMLDAVITFGEEGKTGNKFIELPNVRIFTKSSNSTETDEQRIELLIETFSNYIIKLYNSGVFYTGEGVDFDELLNNLNNIARVGQLDSFKLFTIADLKTIKIDLITHMSIVDYMNNPDSILHNYCKVPYNYSIKNNTPKDDWKLQEKNAINDNDKPTCSFINHNNSIQIK